ncbi:Glycosyltransferase [Thermoproteus tenax Kra 1]|uniref:Glycosyltransferase n=2 Tax=Thermoproteus tenax TaxID=2271 RepID=G4RM75_THETK|nr:Glycosyltransferase [Thermoproteus tenax Kra 1]
MVLNILLIFKFIKYYRAVIKNMRSVGRARALVSSDPLPMSFIVPVKGEPLDVIYSMLLRFADLDYPRDSFEVLVVSDDDEGYFAKLKAVVEATARELGIRARALRRDSGGRYKGSALNWASERAQHDVLVFLDVDSRIPRDAAVRVASAIDDNTLLFLGWDGYTSLFTRLGRALQFTYRYFLLYGAYLGRALTGDVLLALGSGIAIKKSLLKRVGGFCDCVADDYDISLKVLLSGGRVVYDGGVPVSVEIPATYFAFRKQFARWVFNSSYIARKYVARILEAPLPLRERASLILTILQHPLIVATSLFLPLMGLVATYTGYLIPPLPVLALELASASLTFILLYYTTSLARSEGRGLAESLALTAQNALIALLINVTAFVYMVAGFFRDSITWRVTPKGSTQLSFKESLAPELSYIGVVAAVATYALLVHMWTLALSAMALLLLLVYALWLVTR